MSLSKLTNNALIQRVREGKFTAAELELADRLGEAINEIETLVAELRAKNAEVIANGTDPGR